MCYTAAPLGARNRYALYASVDDGDHAIYVHSFSSVGHSQARWLALGNRLRRRGSRALGVQVAAERGGD